EPAAHQRRIELPLLAAEVGVPGRDAGRGLQARLSPGRGAAGERLDGRQGRRGVARLVLAEQREEDLVVGPVEALQAELLPADGDVAAQDAVLDALARRRGADLHDPAQQHLGRLQRLLRQHRDRLRLDDPRLLPGDGLQRVAQVAGVVEADRGDHGDGAVRHVRGVPRAAHARLDHRDVDRRVRERRVRHRGEDLEERQPLRVLAADELDVGQHVPERLGEALLAERLPVDRDPLPQRGQLGAGEHPRAQPALAQQRLDEPCGARLPVRPGDVDHRVGAVRLAEDVDQIPDPVERGVDVPLDPAGHDRGDGAAVVGRLGFLAHGHRAYSAGAGGLVGHHTGSMDVFFREWDRRGPGETRDIARAAALAGVLGLLAPDAPVLTVVGSKGKGTAATYASAFLAAAGLRVCTVTSPALRSNRERIRVDGRAVSEAELASLADALDEAVAALPPPSGGYLSPSGLFTLAGVLHARRTGADAIVLEAGMGGRSDEAALFTPDVAAITPVLLEHAGVLGGTPAEIAAEKLG